MKSPGSFLKFPGGLPVASLALLWTIPTHAFDRPPPNAVRETTRQVLSDPQFTPGMTFGQWLSALLARWDLPVHGTLAQVLVVVLVVWAVITLLAILGHTAWTFYTLWGGSSGGGYGGRATAMPRALLPDVEAQMRSMARQGQFREALRLMMLALVLRLEQAGLVAADDSKTNGDYVRETRNSPSVHQPLVGFVGRFDRLIYGGSVCGKEEYDGLDQLYRRIVSDVATKA